jgi:hypothetical protein
MGSGVDPWKTVQAVPVIPRRIWFRGKKPGFDGGPAADFETTDKDVAGPFEVWAGNHVGEVAASARAARRAKPGTALVPFGLVSTSIRVRQGTGVSGAVA